MAFSLEQIQKLVEDCDPKRPLEGGDKHYVPLDDARGDQPCVDLLRRTILTSGPTSCQLFTGFFGTGKTTELKRLEHKFKEAPHPNGGFVLFVDFEEYIDLFRPIMITDVLRVLAYCVSKEADRIAGSATAPGEAFLEGIYTRVKKWMPDDARLKGVSFAAFGATFMAELKNNPSVHDEIEAAIRTRFQQFANECREAIEDGIRRIRKTKGNRADRFVILADGLEKIRPPGEDEGAIEDSVDRLFTANKELLAVPCHIVYTFPIWLHFRTPILGALYNREPLILPMVSVRDRAGEANETGVGLLCRLLERRISPHEKELLGDDPRAALLPIVRASGGYPRDALRLLRSLLQEEEDFPILPAAIDRQIARLRRTYHSRVLSSERELLEHVRRTHQMPSRDAAQRRAFGKLFADFLILAYRNGEEWFDLHPLVADAPALATDGGSAAS